MSSTTQLHRDRHSSRIRPGRRWIASSDSLESRALVVDFAPWTVLGLWAIEGGATIGRTALTWPPAST